MSVQVSGAAESDTCASASAGEWAARGGDASTGEQDSRCGGVTPVSVPALVSRAAGGTICASASAGEWGSGSWGTGNADSHPLIIFSAPLGAAAPTLPAHPSTFTHVS